jgi:hypothetical protein
MAFAMDAALEQLDGISDVTVDFVPSGDPNYVANYVSWRVTFLTDVGNRRNLVVDPSGLAPGSLLWKVCADGDQTGICEDVADSVHSVAGLTPARYCEGVQDGASDGDARIKGAVPANGDNEGNCIEIEAPFGVADGAPYEYEIVGLESGKEWFSRVTAYNVRGYGPVSAEVHEVPRSVPDAPDFVTFNIVAAEPERLRVYWIEPGGCSALHRGDVTDPATGCTAVHPNDCTPGAAGNACAWSKDNTAGGLGYKYCVCDTPRFAQNGAVGGVTNFKVEWDYANTFDSGVDGMALGEVELDADAAAPQHVADTAAGTVYEPRDTMIPGTHTHTIVDLTPGVDYFVRVSAKTAEGYGPTTAGVPMSGGSVSERPRTAPNALEYGAVELITLPADSTTHVAESVQSLQVQWHPPQFDGGDSVSQYLVEWWRQPGRAEVQYIRVWDGATLLADRTTGGTAWGAFTLSFVGSDGSTDTTDYLYPTIDTDADTTAYEMREALQRSPPSVKSSWKSPTLRITARRRSAASGLSHSSATLVT